MEPRAGRKLLRDLGHFCRSFGEASVCNSYKSSLSMQGPSPLSDAVYWVWFLPVCSFAFIVLDSDFNEWNRLPFYCLD